MLLNLLHMLLFYWLKWLSSSVLQLLHTLLFGSNPMCCKTHYYNSSFSHWSHAGDCNVSLHFTNEDKMRISKDCCLTWWCLTFFGQSCPGCQSTMSACVWKADKKWLVSIRHEKSHASDHIKLFGKQEQKSCQFFSAQESCSMLMVQATNQHWHRWNIVLICQVHFNKYASWLHEV